MGDETPKLRFIRRARHPRAKLARTQAQPRAVKPDAAVNPHVRKNFGPRKVNDGHNLTPDQIKVTPDGLTRGLLPTNQMDWSGIEISQCGARIDEGATCEVPVTRNRGLPLRCF